MVARPSPGLRRPIADLGLVSRSRPPDWQAGETQPDFALQLMALESGSGSCWSLESDILADWRYTVGMSVLFRHI